MDPTFTARLNRYLEDLNRQGLLRALRVVEPSARGGTRVRILDGQTEREAVNFCSNDYLGFAASGRRWKAFQNVETGAGASRLIGGTRAAHRRFERLAADFAEKEAAVLFPSGYQANVGTVSALAEVFPRLLSDALNHASLIDGCRLSKGAVRVVPHLDLEKLEMELAASEEPALLIVEGLYSMDGSVCDFERLRELKRRRPFVLLVDEAHALGTLGPEGKGAAARAGALDLIDVYVGTLGKACGLSGAFVASSREVVDWLINRSRAFIFSTAVSPALAEAAAESLQAVREAQNLRDILARRVMRLRTALADDGVACLGEPFSAIVPVVVGEPRRALAASAALLERGFFVQAIRPPTVPPGTSRLRITVTALHEDDEVAALVAALKEVLKQGKA
ncbi:MAG: pyridoxal phosphate-dependent aminotransferase family protein [Myxococcales bacterium]|nr:MAG: pyridoxal phosphate-dependent aminotransferase family protein [Myxococcales bacterium]